jgi:hypothetical protein
LPSFNIICAHGMSSQLQSVLRKTSSFTALQPHSVTSLLINDAAIKTGRAWSVQDLRHVKTATIVVRVISPHPCLALNLTLTPQLTSGTLTTANQPPTPSFLPLRLLQQFLNRIGHRASPPTASCAISPLVQSPRVASSVSCAWPQPPITHLPPRGQRTQSQPLIASHPPKPRPLSYSGNMGKYTFTWYVVSALRLQ